MKKAAIYVRVSTEEQKKHGLSVDNQLTALQDYCKENNLAVAGIYNDAGISARKSYKKRPALLRMIEDCRSGKIDIILFTKLDRFFRSVSDYYECINQMNNVPWKCIWEDYETETSSGMFKVNIMLSVAQNEADKTSERIKNTLDYKRQRGDYLGKAPTGYKVDNGKLLVNEDEKAAVEELFDTYFRTRSCMVCQKMLKDKYNINYMYQSIRNMLRNMTYTGTTQNGGKCYAYITIEQHNQIVEIMKKSYRPASNSRIYLFSGLLKCGHCGNNIVSHGGQKKKKDGTISFYPVYHCEQSLGNAKHTYMSIKEKDIEQYLLTHLDDIYEMQNKVIIKKNAQLLQSADMINKKKRLEAKLKRLAVLFEDGDISELDYKNKRDAVKMELSECIIEPIPLLKPLPYDWHNIYAELDRQHKKEFWLSIIKSITITQDTKSAPIIELF